MTTRRLPLLTAGLVLALILTAAPAPASGPTASPRVVAPDRWAVLLCRFADSPTIRPFTRAEYNQAFNSDPQGHRRYFQEVSYGRVKIDADVYRWRTIGPRSAYPGSFLTSGYDFLGELFRVCTGKHNATVDFSQYEGIAIFLDDRQLDITDGTACQFGDTCTTNRRIGVSGAAWIDWTAIKRDGATGWRTIWMSNLEEALNEVTDHELMHAYGATHSAAAADNPVQDECFDGSSGQPFCGHPWDPMNAAWLGLPADSHPLAAQKVFNLGWIDGARRCNVTTDGTQDFQLERLAKPRNNGRCLAITIQVPGATTAWYVVEARFPVGFERDSSALFGGGGIPGAGVLISRICTGDDFFCTHEPMVVGRDLNPQDGMIDTGSAYWQAGESFTNYTGAIQVQVLSKGAGFYTVRVTRDSTP